MKIAIIMPLAEQRGGGELTLWHLMQQRENLGIEWIVIFLEEGPLADAIRGSGVETLVVEAGRLRQPVRFVAAVIGIARILRQSKATLVFAWMSKAHLYSSLAALLARKPALWYQHGLPSQKSRLDHIATWLPAQGILACSQITAYAQARMRPARPIKVVYPGVELERFDPTCLESPQETRRRLGLPINGPLIGIVGRLQRWKGFHVLAEAMPCVLERFPDAHCVMVGGRHDLEPEYLPELESQIASLGIGQAVILAGMQTNIPEWMQAMDVIVHASDREPFGIVIIEAMALGKPVIAGDRGGPTEIITDGDHGLLTPYGDAGALSSAILRYLDDPEFASQRGISAQKRAQEFSTRNYAVNFFDAVKQLSSNGREANAL